MAIEPLSGRSTVRLGNPCPDTVCWSDTSGVDQQELLSHGREDRADEPARRVVRQRRWRRVWIVGAVAIALLAASGWVGYRVALDRVKGPDVVVLPMPGGYPSGGGVAAGAVWVTVFSSGSDNPLPGSVVRVDPTTGKVVARIRVGASPLAVADAFGSVWVSNGDGGTVTRIDPVTNRVIATIPVGPVPYQMAPVDGRLWVSTQTSAVRLDPTNNAVDMRVKLPLPKYQEAPAQPGLGLAGDARGVWVSTAIGTVVRIRPQDGKVVKVIRVLPDRLSSPGMVAIDGDHVWVSLFPVAGRPPYMAQYGVGASVASISVSTGRVDQRVPTGGLPIDWILPTHQRLYMVGNDTDTKTGVLFRSDWPYNVLTAARGIGYGSFAIMIAGGHMWIPSFDKEALYRLPIDG